MKHPLYVPVQPNTVMTVRELEAECVDTKQLKEATRLNWTLLTKNHIN